MAWVTESIVMAPLALSAIFAAIPALVVHLRAKNFPASVLIIGITILNVQNFMNAIIWHSVDRFSWWDGKILCDIEVKLYIGIFQAIDGSITSIFRQVCTILHPDHLVMAPSPRQRKITLVIELILCIFLPLYTMIGHYLTQRTRYWVRISAGCVATYDNNRVAPFLTYLWPFVVSIIGSIYCLVSFVRLRKHRKQMASVLSQIPGPRNSRFYRLFALACTLLAIYCPASTLIFVRNVRVPLHVYSWSYIHPPDWSQRIIEDIGSSVGELHITPDRWAQVLTAYLCFAFFGLGQEATQMYKDWITHTKRVLGLQPRSNQDNSGQPSLELVRFGAHQGGRLPEHRPDSHIRDLHLSTISELDS
ncbi:a-factor receptor [Cladophialophora chaetospira]|uniref:A-factor receptor n=1 Tax=Cladophialophora chaetospira TaxID=386627 RepID=A0AA38XET2_9EURO|nr:a-factor receptor [Cladophialophora chaetospira]